MVCLNVDILNSGSGHQSSEHPSDPQGGHTPRSPSLSDSGLIAPSFWRPSSSEVKPRCRVLGVSLLMLQAKCREGRTADDADAYPDPQERLHIALR